VVFGWFGKKSDAQTIEKHAQRVANKRAQAPDRWDSIQALSQLLAHAKKENATDRCTAVVAALLPRFGYYTDPTITDQEEKDLAFRVILEAGTDGVPAIRAYMKSSESLTWPLKMLDRLLTPSEVTAELLSVLEPMDTEYQRDPQRKLQILQALEERRDPRIGPTVSRFFDDVNETARFHAVGAVLCQEDAEMHRELAEKLLTGEESVRVKTRVLERFAERGWPLTVARAAIEKVPPPAWTIASNGAPTRR
jgi:hypothetical protein